MQYLVTIEADVSSSLSAEELRDLLVVSLFNVETGEKIGDGEGKTFEVIDYNQIQVIPRSLEIDSQQI